MHYFLPLIHLPIILLIASASVARRTYHKNIFIVLLGISTIAEALYLNWRGFSFPWIALQLVVFGFFVVLVDALIGEIMRRRKNKS